MGRRTDRYRHRLRKCVWNTVWERLVNYRIYCISAKLMSIYIHASPQTDWWIDKYCTHTCTKKAKRNQTDTETSRGSDRQRQTHQKTRRSSNEDRGEGGGREEGSRHQTHRTSQHNSAVVLVVGQICEAFVNVSCVSCDDKIGQTKCDSARVYFFSVPFS